MFKKRKTVAPTDRPRTRYSERANDDPRPAMRSFSYQSIRQPGTPQRPAGRSNEEKRRERLRSVDSLSMPGGERHQRLRAVLRHTPGIVAVLLLLCGIFYNLGVSVQPRIQINGEVDSASMAQHDEYERIVAEAFAKLPVTARTKLTFDSEALSVQLQQHHPELGGVRISLPFFGQRPVVHLETPPRSFVYSNARISAAILDSSGRVLSLGSTAELPRVSDTSNLEATVGKQVLPSDEAAFMRLVYDELRAKGIKVERFTLPAVMGRLEFRVEGAPYLVRMTMSQAPAEQIGAFLATREELAKQGIMPAEYLDVRVSGRIYYK